MHSSHLPLKCQQSNVPVLASQSYRYPGPVQRVMALELTGNSLWASNGSPGGLTRLLDIEIRKESLLRVRGGDPEQQHAFALFQRLDTDVPTSDSVGEPERSRPRRTRRIEGN